MKEQEIKQYNLGKYKILEYSELDSTNSEAERLRRGKLEDRMVILTRRQTGGRGQEGNNWESEPGKNLSLTIVYRPAVLPAAAQFKLSMALSLGVYDFVSRYLQGCKIKWPNDIYVGEDKVAGILIEHLVMGGMVELSLCGIGLNVNQAHFTSEAPNPVSMFQLLGYELPLEQALEELLESIERRYEWLDDDQMLRHDYMYVLYRRTGVYDWEDEGGFFRASVEGVNDYGQLILKDEDKKERIYGFKEVKYL